MSSSVAENNLLLYGHFDSGHVYKVALFLTLANVSHRYEHVDIWADKSSRQAPFLAHSRNGEVPCLVMSGVPCIQSNVILQKLARHNQLFGGESEDRLLRALDWQFWEANRLGMCLPQLRYARRFAPNEFNPESLAFLTARYEADIALLESRLSTNHAAGQRFVLDDSPSIADFSLCGYLFWAEEAGVVPPPAVANWLQHIRELDGWTPPYDLMEKKAYVA